MRAFRSKEGHDEAGHATEGVDWVLLFLEIFGGKGQKWQDVYISFEQENERVRLLIVQPGGPPGLGKGLLNDVMSIAQLQRMS